MSTDPLADALSEATIQQPVRSPELAEAWGPNLTVDVLQGEPDDETAQRIAAWLRDPANAELLAREIPGLHTDEPLRWVLDNLDLTYVDEDLLRKRYNL